jgi:sorbitol-specific phosphotransferase system component IIC
MEPTADEGQAQSRRGPRWPRANVVVAATVAVLGGWTVTWLLADSLGIVGVAAGLAVLGSDVEPLAVALLAYAVAYVLTGLLVQTLLLLALRRRGALVGPPLALVVSWAMPSLPLAPYVTVAASLVVQVAVLAGVIALRTKEPGAAADLAGTSA